MDIPKDPSVRASDGNEWIRQGNEKIEGDLDEVLFRLDCNIANENLTDDNQQTSSFDFECHFWLPEEKISYQPLEAYIICFVYHSRLFFHIPFVWNIFIPS